MVLCAPERVSVVVEFLISSTWNAKIGALNCANLIARGIVGIQELLHNCKCIMMIADETSSKMKDLPTHCIFLYQDRDLPKVKGRRTLIYIHTAI